MKKIILATLAVATFSSSAFILGSEHVFGEEQESSRKTDINEYGRIELTDYFTLHGDAELIDSNTVRLTKAKSNQFGAITLNSKLTFGEKSMNFIFDVDYGTASKGGNGIGAAFHNGKVGEIGKAGINGSGLGILGLKDGLGFEVNTYLDPTIPSHEGSPVTGPHLGFVNTDQGDYLEGNSMTNIPLPKKAENLGFFTHSFGNGIIFLRNNYGNDLYTIGPTVYDGQETTFILAATTGTVGNEQTVKLKNLEARLSIPKLKANNIEIEQDESFNPFDSRIGLEASDKKPGDLTDKIKVAFNNVNSAIPGNYKVTYEVKNSRNEVAKKTITVKVKINDTWPNGQTAGWKMFSGQDIQLVKDPENALVGEHTFYSENHASLYKHFKGAEALEKGAEYRATVYVKPQDGKPENNRVKMSLKADPSGNESRELINNYLSKDQLAEKGYYRISKTFRVGENEANPLIVIENFSAGYVGSINLSKISN